MSNRQKRGIILVILGLSMVFAAMTFYMANERQDDLAGENAAVLLRQLELCQVMVTTLETTEETAEIENIDASEVAEEVQEVPESVNTSSEMPKKVYLEYNLIGTLRAPSVGVQLPVLDDWSYDLLNISPCRYSGSVAEANFVVMGHNYKSHFAPLHKLVIGDKLEFEDVNGISYRYEVAELVHLHKTQGEDLASSYPLTLFTCTPGGQKRLVVRCVEIE